MSSDDGVMRCDGSRRRTRVDRVPEDPQRLQQLGELLRRELTDEPLLDEVQMGGQHVVEAGQTVLGDDGV
jgi:hypothetical protein